MRCGMGQHVHGHGDSMKKQPHLALSSPRCSGQEAHLPVRERRGAREASYATPLDTRLRQVGGELDLAGAVEVGHDEKLGRMSCCHLPFGRDCNMRRRQRLALRCGEEALARDVRFACRRREHRGGGPCEQAVAAATLV
eukprot:CAMPEP_0183371686 /NCGR_PEP_ID=MMETSP0164_2-20130417/106178_1 /TAXON_ID=221442 /ORGANISM="Coccolithus pelagicus ssp braarudi, Strain PLY182g" /LENGTH=138 /DNA_ID=CAMNT_0025548277 /DNA_START=296 /DNA_END=712 /DNA_ORIENTATION=-